MALAFQHRARQLAVRAATLKVLARLWKTVDAARLAATIQPFADAAAVVVGDGYRRSARTASAFYLLSRPSGITTLTVPELAPPVVELTAAKLRAASLSGILNARRAGQSLDAATANGFVKLAGTASGLVLDGGRETILEAATLDPASTGRWERITGPKSCEFCQMLQSRGAVYSDDTASFAAHDHCGCAAAPEFR